MVPGSGNYKLIIRRVRVKKDRATPDIPFKISWAQVKQCTRGAKGTSEIETIAAVPRKISGVIRDLVAQRV